MTKIALIENFAGDWIYLDVSEEVKVGDIVSGICLDSGEAESGEVLRIEGAAKLKEEQDKAALKAKAERKQSVENTIYPHRDRSIAAAARRLGISIDDYVDDYLL